MSIFLYTNNYQVTVNLIRFLKSHQIRANITNQGISVSIDTLDELDRFEQLITTHPNLRGYKLDFDKLKEDLI